MISLLLSCRAGIYSDCVSPALSAHYDTPPSWPSIRGSMSVCEQFRVFSLLFEYAPRTKPVNGAPTPPPDSLCPRQLCRYHYTPLIRIEMPHRSVMASEPSILLLLLQVCVIIQRLAIVCVSISFYDFFTCVWTNGRL